MMLLTQQSSHIRDHFISALKMQKGAGEGSGYLREPSLSATQTVTQPCRRRPPWRAALKRRLQLRWDIYALDLEDV